MRGWPALLHQTAHQAVAELLRLDPENRIGGMARVVLEAAEAEGIKPSGRQPGSEGKTVRERRAERAADKLALQRRAAEIYATGLSLIETGKRVGHSAAWVSDALMVLGIKARQQGPHSGTIDPERVERIRQWRAEHPPKTLDWIGAQLQISRERVRQLCAANGIDSSWNSELDERQLQAVAEYLAGASLEFVAEAYQVGTSAVRNWVIRAGHLPRLRQRRLGPETKAASAQAVQLYRQGFKAREIANKLGLPHPEMIYRLLAIGGIRPDRNSGAGQHRRVA